MNSPRSCGSLQKQARKLEERLDYQMHLYRKLVSRKAGCGKESNLGSGIEQLLKQLQQVISEMHAWVSSEDSETEMFSHTLTRHMEIHRDVTQEFNRLRSSLRTKRDGSGSQEHSLLKERALIRSTGQMNSILWAIRKKKSMKTIILSSVAAACTFLILIFLSRN